MVLSACPPGGASGPEILVLQQPGRPPPVSGIVRRADSMLPIVGSMFPMSITSFTPYNFFLIFLCFYVSSLIAPPIATSPRPTKEAKYGARIIKGKAPVENHMINIEAI